MTAKQSALHDHGHDVRGILEINQTIILTAAVGAKKKFTGLWVVVTHNDDVWEAQQEK
jgi:hypothetical protein